MGQCYTSVQVFTPTNSHLRMNTHPHKKKINKNKKIKRAPIYTKNSPALTTIKADIANMGALVVCAVFVLFVMCAKKKGYKKYFAELWNVVSVTFWGHSQSSSTYHTHLIHTYAHTYAYTYGSYKAKKKKNRYKKRCPMDIIDVQTVYQAMHPEIRLPSDMANFDNKIIKQLIYKLNESHWLKDRNLKINHDLFSATLQRSKRFCFFVCFFF